MVDAGSLNTIVETFVDSPAFEGNMEHLIGGLESLGTRLPLSAVRACERATDVSGNELGDIRTTRAAVAQSLVAVVLRLYRQGDEATRRRCLDLVDRLIEMNAHGLDAALAEER
jgi:hypothetical protein